MILIPVCTERHGWVHPALCEALLKMQSDDRFEVSIGFLKDIQPFHVMRNAAVITARDAGSDWLLMIDNDEAFPSANPLDVLAQVDVDMHIVGMAAFFPDPASPSGFGLSMRGNLGRRGNFREVAHCGTGVLALRRTVWKRLSPPWFLWETDPTTGLTIEKVDDFGPVRMNEDYWFCEKARAAGFKIWVHEDVVGHFKTCEVSGLGFTLGKLLEAKR